ncbi:hypothetical protein CMT41_06825 [Colwellia sp. MT41]|uniref:DUF2897 domain-containing protein n=1 Tax=Colwellia marinimaniae TaxID=1513592 RepID=A0ABQ0MYU7_9GAMM|nr:hypothetical protein CMT41_06825 [Colwellia sp. MT41]GAW97509.1 hypothetical protein MTCD1_03136 [Colwellia marinimaniae]
MDNGVAIFMIVIALAIIIGNLSTLQKNAKQKMRKHNLNDLKETLPRSNKSAHKLATYEKNKP